MSYARTTVSDVHFRPANPIRALVKEVFGTNKPACGPAMPRVLIVAGQSPEVHELSARLTEKGYPCLLVNMMAAERAAAEKPDAVLLEAAAPLKAAALAQLIKRENAVPVIALVRRESLPELRLSIDIDDFIVEPFGTDELELRLKRLLVKPGRVRRGTISVNGLVIDPERCEVSLDGRVITLTFKEYELLKFLADNPGRVFTREALLNGVWGSDYLGGDRTVDVHVRRLRGKIEDKVTYIETIRNIGYRFCKPDLGAKDTYTRNIPETYL